MMNIYLEIVLVNYRFANAMELAEGPFLSSTSQPSKRGLGTIALWLQLCPIKHFLHLIRKKFLYLRQNTLWCFLYSISF